MVEPLGGPNGAHVGPGGPSIWDGSWWLPNFQTSLVKWHQISPMENWVPFLQIHVT